MTRLRDRLTFGGRVSYMVWRLLGTSEVKVRLDDAAKTTLLLRRPPATDTATANEIYVGNVYVSPEPLITKAGRVLRIADLGVNVGYSLLYFCRTHPEATITAYEPHPVFCERARTHLAMNGLTTRVILHEAAASVETGHVVLTDEENCSKVTTAAEGLRVAKRDVFADLGSDAIDLFKIDIEGAEYVILADERFAALRPSTIVLEWHNTDAVSSGKSWCEARLAELKYRVVHTFQGDSHGVLWAYAR